MPNATLKRWNGTAWVSILTTPASHTHPISDVTNLQTTLNTKANYGSTANADSTFLYRSFSMLENVSPQYIILCVNAAYNDVSGTIDLDRTTGNYQSARLDIIVTSGSSLMYGGSLTSHQNVQTAYPNEEKYDLVTLTYNSVSYVAVRYTGNPYPWTVARFTGRLNNTGSNTLVTVSDAQVTNVADFANIGKFNFDVANVEINENVVWHAGNDGTGSTLDADLLDGNHASAFALASHSHAISDVTGLQTALDAKIPLTQKAAANGVATLDANTKIPLAQLPDAALTGFHFIGTMTGATDLLDLVDGTGIRQGDFYVATTTLNITWTDDPENFYIVNPGDEGDSTSPITLEVGDMLALAKKVEISQSETEWTFSVINNNDPRFANYLPLTGGTLTGDLIISNTLPKLFLTDTDNNSDYSIWNNNGTFSIRDETNSSMRLTINSTGNVGIGTTGPSSLLNILGADPILTIQDTETTGASANSRLRLAESTTGNVLDNYIDLGLIGTNFQLFSKIGVNEGTRLHIDGITGNVGIGTTSPSYKLTIEDSADTILYINKTTPNWSGYSTGTHGFRIAAPNMGNTSNLAALEFGKAFSTLNSAHIDYMHRGDGSTSNYLSLGLYGNNEILNIAGTGNVGIGTTSPSILGFGREFSVSAIGLGTPTAYVNVQGSRTTDIDVGALVFNNSVSGTNSVISSVVSARSGANNSGRLTFFTANAGTITEKMTILPNGNVGIGTTAPTNLLHVKGNGASINIDRNTDSYGASLLLSENGVKKWEIKDDFDGSNENRLQIAGADNTVRLTIAQVGNVGIGTSSPLNKLEVRVTGGDSNNGIMITRDDTTTTTDEILGGIGFDSTDGNVPSSVLEASAYVAAFAAEDHSTGDKGGYLTFGTAPIDQDDDTVSLERMRIKADGYVGIGTTTTPHLLTVNGNVGANGFYASDRIVFGDIVGYDTPYIGWNGSSTPYQLRIADPAYEDPIIIDTEAVSISANKFIANSTISVGTSLQGTATITTTFTSQSLLTSYAVATYATGKFLIQATSGGNRHISELLVTHNGTVSTATEYGILKTAGNLFTVTTDISGGNVRILVTSASATSTVYRTTFTLIGV